MLFTTFLSVITFDSGYYFNILKDGICLTDKKSELRR